MKVTITIDGKPVEIELTAEQIAKVTKKASHYTDIKTLQDALDYVGESIESFNHRTQFDDDVQRAYKELEIIVKAIRHGNELDEGDKRYYPWFNSRGSLVGFSYGGDHLDYTHSHVGSRLCVDSSEKTKYLGTQFLSVYDRYINGDKLKESIYPSPLENTVFNSYKDIKTFDDACAAVGLDPIAFHESRKNLADDTYAYEQLKVISKALNGGNHMNYNDTDEYKYFPFFTALGSSVGFSRYDYYYAYSHSFVGSRIAYKSRDIAIYAGNQFLGIYDKYIN